MSKKERDKARRVFAQIMDSKRPLARMYVFEGDESFLIDEAIARVTRRMFGRREPDPFRYELLRGSDADGKQIVQAARTLSMMGGERLVIVRDVEQLADREVSAIAEYASAPVEHCVLVMAAHGKLDGRKKSWSKIKKAAESLRFNAFYNNEMSGWVRRRAKQRKLRIDSDAADYIAEALGTEMAMIDRALDKLRLHVGDSKERVRLELAQEVVAHTRERGVFELTAALSKRDLAASLEALHDLMEQRAQPVYVCAMVARHTRMLLKLKAAQQESVPASELPKLLGVHPRFFREYERGASKFSLAELMRLHQRVFHTDWQLKSARTPSATLLETLLVEMCSRRA